MSHVVAVVLAAGDSSRMGRPKMAMKIGQATMLGGVLSALRASKVEATVVVLGADEMAVRSAVKFVDEKVVVNHGHHEGMGSSLRTGLAAVPENADAVVVVLGDQPFVRAATIDRIIDAYLDSSKAIVAPLFAGRRGNPVLFARSMFPALMKIRGDIGAKFLIEKKRKDLLEVEVEDEGVVVDIDTAEDYHKIGLRVQRRGSI